MMSNKEIRPVGGQSHWCEGRNTDETRCQNIVRNDSDHCEAGHANAIHLLHYDLTPGDLEALADTGSGLSFEADEAFHPFVEEYVANPSGRPLIVTDGWCPRCGMHSLQRGRNDIAVCTSPQCLWRGGPIENYAEPPVGWIHEVAKRHDVVERLRERCAVYAGGKTCLERNLKPEDWCERCIAAHEIETLRSRCDVLLQVGNSKGVDAEVTVAEPLGVSALPQLLPTKKHWWSRAKVMCPECETPQRVSRNGVIIPHRRYITRTIYFHGIKNRDEPPSLRSSRNLDDWSEPPGEREVGDRVWCHRGYPAGSAREIAVVDRPSTD
jgi:hypothetical protein